MSEEPWQAPDIGQKRVELRRLEFTFSIWRFLEISRNVLCLVVAENFQLLVG